MSTPRPLSHPRMNSPRRSGVPLVPSAGDHPDGHDARLNADIVPIGASAPVHEPHAVHRSIPVGENPLTTSHPLHPVVLNILVKYPLNVPLPTSPAGVVEGYGMAHTDGVSMIAPTSERREMSEIYIRILG